MVKICQFEDKDLVYHYEEKRGVVAADSNEDKNSLIKTVLDVFYKFLALKDEVLIEKETLTVLLNCDNEFYSYKGEEKKEKCFKYKKHIKEVNKTGLGSSAALNISLITCLMEYYQINYEKEIVFKLGFIVNRIYQMKIGSGFDVSSCIFGSQIYSTIENAEAKKLIDNIENQFSLDRILDLDWNVKITNFSLNSSYRLIIGDVDCGTSTPLMVKQVLNWKENNKNDETWKKLIEYNEEARDLFIQLEKSNNAETIKKIKIINKKIREKYQEISKLSKVEIEPAKQTKLLDETAGLEGVIFCGVPGAGGYDAIFAIVNKDCFGLVKNCWEKYPNLKVKVLNTECDTNIASGIKVEAPSLTEYFINRETFK